MRRSLGLLLVGSFLLAITAVASSGEKDALAVITKSIKASGGEKALEKHKAARLKESGTYYGMGDGLPYTGVYAYQQPGQFRMEIENVFTLVFNKDKGWVSAAGETKDMTKEQVAVQKGEQQVREMASLLVLRDTAFSLTSAADAKVDNQDTRVVKASRKDWPEVKLFFDKKTNYLIKIEYKTIAEELGNKEVTMDVTMSEFKDVDGAKVAYKRVVNRDGKKFVEAELTEITPVGKLDDKTFARP
jgi:outer membrane lipoprotein-sorting protein